MRRAENIKTEGIIAYRAQVGLRTLPLFQLELKKKSYEEVFDANDGSI